ncbi:MAG: hypothetical protein JWM25_1072, partial [Thermoleophilia bacterium]|nr:hypothetical protein [Thermoleophilia bacterium]
PGLPRVTLLFLLLALLMTLIEFSRFGTSPTVLELTEAGGSSLGAIANGSWWKLLAANLLHSGIGHLAMNVLVIYLMGRWLEHFVGRLVTVGVIVWSALLASGGSILIDDASVTIGASGVGFGLVGCALAVDPRARTAVGVIARQLAIVNVIGTFVIPGISIGGHLGGLVGGALVGLVAWRRGVVQPPEVEQEVGADVGGPRRGGLAILFAVGSVLVAVLAVGPRVLPDEAAELRGSIVAPLLGSRIEAAADESAGGDLSIDCERTDDPRVYGCAVTESEGARSTLRVEFARTDLWTLR